MVSFNKNNLLTWLVAILVVANIVVVTLLFLGHQHNPPPKPASPAEFLIEKLGLDQKQQVQLHQLAQKHHLESEKIRGKLRAARDHFFDLIRQPNVEDSTKNNAASAVVENLKLLDLLTYDHFLEIRRLCDPAQQKIFDGILNEAIRMISGPPPAPKAPGDRQRGPGDQQHPPPGNSPPDEMPPGPNGQNDTSR